MDDTNNLVYVNDDAKPLCVDLDHTLVKSDTLIEAGIDLVRRNPFNIVRMAIWLLKGRASFKHQVSKHSDIDPALLPYNREVFFYLKRMINRNRPIFLVTGASTEMAEKVAEHLGFFDGVLSSTPDFNNIGENKANLLVKKFGEKNFDYIGDSNADLKVWAHANSAIVVTSNRSLAKKVSKISTVDKVIYEEMSVIKLTIKTLRIHQWTKNFLIFLPMLLAGTYNDFPSVMTTVMGFLSFCFLASTIYIINDIYDLNADRQHHEKKNRPYASGRMPLQTAFLFIPILIIGSLVCATKLPISFWFILATYAITTNLYTFWLKRVPIVDTFILSGLYSIRLISGSLITGVALSPWLIAFSGFIFLSLALIKRCSELYTIRESGLFEPIGRGYHINDFPLLTSIGVSCGIGACVVFALYINSGIPAGYYPNEKLLWVFCPMLIYWISRLWFITNRGQMHSDPVKFAITDRVSLIIAGFGVAIWLLARYTQPFL